MSQLWAMISRELRTISIAVLIGMQRILFICKDWVLIAIYLIVFIQRERHKLNSSWQFKIVSVNSKIALHWWQWSYVKKNFLAQVLTNFLYIQPWINWKEKREVELNESLSRIWKRLNPPANLKLFAALSAYASYPIRRGRPL